MHIEYMYRYTDENGNTIISGHLPQGITPDETMDILNAEDGYDLIRIADGENVGANIWLHNGDVQENYREEEHEEEEDANN